MQSAFIFQLLVLLSVANGTPIAAKLLMRDRLACPLDGGALFADGRPLFGPSKTIRGIVISVLATTGVAALIGLCYHPGADIKSVKRFKE
jgi:CDP-2,3-bis-(O-geranylgeranyl)-sn-glycerol synthase